MISLTCISVSSCAIFRIFRHFIINTRQWKAFDRRQKRSVYAHWILCCCCSYGDVRIAMANKSMTPKIYKLQSLYISDGNSVLHNNFLFFCALVMRQLGCLFLSVSTTIESSDVCICEYRFDDAASHKWYDQRSVQWRILRLYSIIILCGVHLFLYDGKTDDWWLYDSSKVLGYMTSRELHCALHPTYWHCSFVCVWSIISRCCTMHIAIMRGSA